MKGRRSVLLGSVFLVLSLFLTWAKITSMFGTIRMAGYKTNGLLVGGLGIILLMIGIAWKGKPGKMYSAIASLLAFLVGGIALWTWLFLPASKDGVSSSSGLGLWIAVLGALLAFIGGLLKRPNEAEAAAELESPPSPEPVVTGEE